MNLDRSKFITVQKVSADRVRHLHSSKGQCEEDTCHQISQSAKAVLLVCTWGEKTSGYESRSNAAWLFVSFCILGTYVLRIDGFVA